MDSVRQYILTIIAATIVSTAVLALTDKKSVNNSILRLLTGIFVILTVMSPLKDFKTIDMTKYFSDWTTDASVYVQQGEIAANTEKESFIKEQTKAYILDRAAQLGIEIEVEVDLSDDQSVPQIIYIVGDASPYNKEKLQYIIAQELGVTEENQIWT